MSTVTSYYKQMLGFLKGDNAQVIAAKNERKSNSAIQGQLAALRAKQVDDESRVEDTQEALTKAYFPTDLITDNGYYIRNIIRAKEALDTASTTLTSTKDSITFFEGLAKDFSITVSAE